MPDDITKFTDQELADEIRRRRDARVKDFWHGHRHGHEPEEAYLCPKCNDSQINDSQA